VRKISIVKLLEKTNPYIKSVCKKPIFIVSFLLATSLLCYFRNYIHNQRLLMFIISIYFPPIIVWIIKSRKNSGKPWGGGIVSGHATYTSTVYFLTVYSLSEIAINFILPLIPALFIIISRYNKIKQRSAIKGLIIGFLLQLVTIILLCVYSKNWMIIIANVVLLLLVIEAYSVNNIHKKNEILYGIVLGIISTILFITIFKAW
jgi:hypothetical protein